MVSRTTRVEVTGPSMLPTLRPGDRLLVLERCGPWRRPRPGDLVTFVDPRPGGRELVKRFARMTADNAELAGDNPDASTDSRVFGALPPTTLTGRAVYRYAPSSRVGRL
jgi:nickel-type superoxide dismutase maturation protease